jgi:hypothetical protein
MVHIYYIFLIRSSVVGRLGCFQSLAIINSAAVNMVVQVALPFPGVLLSDMCQGVVSLDHMVVLFSVF